MATLHILSSPHNPVRLENRVDAFAVAAFKFIKHMTLRGWNCVHYGVIGCEVDCETVICLDQISSDSAVNVEVYNQNAAKEIAQRKSPGDFILCFYGHENKAAAQANSDLKIVEPSIGYTVDAVFAPYRVFVSYAQMHFYYGKAGMLMNPSWNDEVIYNAISADDFDYCEIKDDYVLFFGRVIEHKGIHVAIQATQAAGKKLVIAGPGNLYDLNYQDIPSHVELVGVCDVQQRKQLMSRARAIIGPTYYIEPFGNMIPEAYMSGTPAITSDWGGFAETVVHGVTGFRCREFKEFVSAIANAEFIDPAACRNWAMRNCEDSVIHDKFDRYLKKLQDGNFYR